MPMINILKNRGVKCDVENEADYRDDKLARKPFFFLQNLVLVLVQQHSSTTHKTCIFARSTGPLQPADKHDLCVWW